MKTVREKVIELLISKDEPLTAHQMAELLGLDEKEGERVIYLSIPHIAKTIKRRFGRTLNMMPPVCVNCGFTFNKLRANRCPKCRSERIMPAKFFVK